MIAKLQVHFSYFQRVVFFVFWLSPASEDAIANLSFFFNRLYYKADSLEKRLKRLPFLRLFFEF